VHAHGQRVLLAAGIERIEAPSSSFQVGRGAECHDAAGAELLRLRTSATVPSTSGSAAPRPSGSGRQCSALLRSIRCTRAERAHERRIVGQRPDEKHGGKHHRDIDPSWSMSWSRARGSRSSWLSRARAAPDRVAGLRGGRAASQKCVRPCLATRGKVRPSISQKARFAPSMIRDAALRRGQRRFPRSLDVGVVSRPSK